MLRLLAQREEGYEDIAALMGLSVDEVRAKVKEALSSLEDSGQGTGEPPPQVKTPPPQEPSPSSPTPGPKPAKPPSAGPKPQKPSPKPPQKPSPSSPKSTATGTSRLPMPQDRGTRWAIAAGLGVTVVLILLLITGVLGGDGDDSAESTTAGADNPSAELANGSKQATQAVLKAVDGSDGKGAALFGRAGQEVRMVFHADGLAPTANGESYVISLARSPTERGPIAAAKVDESGEVNEEFKVSPEAVGLLASGFDEMEVSLVSNAKLRSALERAKGEGGVPTYSGTPVLRGQVEGPAVDAAARGQR